MNQKGTVFSDDVVLAAPAYTRLDLRQRDIVDDGIAVQQSSNTMAAFEYLRERDVNARVIERVLLEPELRRVPGD